MTLFHLLTEGTRALEQSGNPDAGNDAKQLLLAAFHLDTVHFLLNRMQELEDNDYNRSCTDLYHSMIQKRRRRIPQQQILGCQEFMGLNFYVNKHVLIPRQDTETLVERVLEEQCGGRMPGAGCGAGTVPGHEPDGSTAPGIAGRTLLDLCTGSGCIAISLAVKGDFASVTATDISGEALKVARRNADAHGCADRMEFLQGDLFEALAGADVPQRFDVITSNPPYIPTAVIKTLEPEVREHEPMLALDGTEDGLHFYRRIAAEAGAFLKDGGAIYLEIGYDQGEAVSGLLREAGYTDVLVLKDLPGNDRVVRASWTEH
ncbi:MAG: peptide chain release factor N(5)-glutamine methyltransferase [Eubacteriales bacterium]|nr:peptide chain release factor N(5)-glutamine methyltransferase [Eubacteriales bacterium]